MGNRYQDIYPSSPILNSGTLLRPSAADLLTLEYFEAPPGEMPEKRFKQHHVLINLKEDPTHVENFREGKHIDFIFKKDEIVVTPAGIKSGWRWHETSRVIVVTLEPGKLERFAQHEVGVLLTTTQLKNIPLFSDPDICQAGIMLKDALTAKGIGSDILFESLARVFLVKLIQKYGDRPEEELKFARGFTSAHYKRVLDYVEAHFSKAVSAGQTH